MRNNNWIYNKKYEYECNYPLEIIEDLLDKSEGPNNGPNCVYVNIDSIGYDIIGDINVRRS